MLKKLMALFIIFSFSHVYAAPTAQIAALNSALNNLNYNLTVVWDQQDTGYMNSQMTAFERQLEQLQANGISNQDLIDNTLATIKDKKLAKEVKDLFSVVSANEMNNEEAREFIMGYMNETYAQGSSWSGGKLKVKMAFILILVTVLIIVVKHHQDDGDFEDDYDDNHGDCGDGTGSHNGSGGGQCGGGGHGGEGSGTGSGGGDGSGHLDEVYI